MTTRERLGVAGALLGIAIALGAVSYGLWTAGTAGRVAIGFGAGLVLFVVGLHSSGDR